MGALQLMWLLFLVGCLTVTLKVEALSGSKYCAACRAIINDVDWAVNQVDPRKKVKVGNYRVNPDGTVNAKEKSYARSEAHLTEVFEDICEKMTDYAEMTDADGSKQIVRIRSQEGQMLKTRHLDLNRDVGNTLKYRCHDFLENHEEEVIDILRKENLPNYELAICVEETGACTEDEISKPLEILPEVTFEDAPIEHGKEFGDDDDEEEDDDNDDEDEEGREEEEENGDDSEEIEVNTITDDEGEEFDPDRDEL